MTIMSTMNTITKLLGPIGYIAKAIIYSTIGVLCITSSIMSTTKDEGPQGVFLLLNNTGATIGLVLLIGLFVCMVSYILWRVAEAFFVPNVPNLVQVKTSGRRFFRYRFSPIISAIIYTSYAYLLIVTLIQRRNSVNSSSCFPECWYQTGIGIFGLVMLGICFAIASLSQFEMAWSMDYIYELRLWVQRSRLVRMGMIVLGILGFVGRTLLFGLISITFFILATGTNIWTDPDHSTIGQSLNHWVNKTGGRFVLFSTGLLLIVYGVFILASVACRAFPTMYLRDVRDVETREEETRERVNV